MESKPSVAFDKLLLGIAMGARDETTLTIVASRLARLDRIKATDPDEIERVAEASRLSLFEDQRQDASATLSLFENQRQDASATFNFFNTEAETTKFEGAYLPHWHQDEVIYFVTFRLADSLPQEKLKAFIEEKELWQKQNPEPHTPEQKADYHKRFPQRLQRWLDLGYESMILKHEEAARIVNNAITHFEGDRYTLDEFVVAANHVHVLVAPQGEHTLSDILHSWKSFNAKQLLKLPIADQLSTAPTVWQKESWDHIVRSEASLNKFHEYIRTHKVAEASRLSPTWEELRRDAAATLADEAAKPLASNPALRDLLEAKRRKTDVTIDHLTGDTVISAGYDEEKARQLVTSWKQFLEDNQDEITALQILYNKPHAKRHLVYEELKTLAEAVGRPPYHIAPAEVWKAYEHLQKRPVTADPVKTLTNLITLVRHTVDPQKTPLAPFPELVEERFQRWLEGKVAEASRLSSSENQRQDASATFTPAQIHWLTVIKNYVALNGAFATAYLDAWQSVDSDEGVPLAVATRIFGKDALKPIIEELNQALIA